MNSQNYDVKLIFFKLNLDVLFDFTLFLTVLSFSMTDFTFGEVGNPRLNGEGFRVFCSSCRNCFLVNRSDVVIYIVIFMLIIILIKNILLKCDRLVLFYHGDFNNFPAVKLS